MTHIILEQFLATGHLGELHLSLSKSEVRQILGEPTDYSERRKKSEIWKYDGLEIAFDDLVCFIGLDFENGVTIVPQSLVASQRLIIERRATDDFERFLRDRQIHFEMVETLTFDEQRTIQIEQSGVSVCFFQGQLVSIQLSEL